MGIHMTRRAAISAAIVAALLAACTAAAAAAAITISRKHQHQERHKASCDVFAGAWVADESYPLYDSASCPFIRSEFDCRRFDRPDTGYLRYRWQPTPPCSLPRFDGVALLRMWSGKKVMFVGDSLALNQYESLLCMIHAAVPDAVTTVSPRSGKIDPSTTVTFEEYNVTLVYYLTHYLVDIVTEKAGRVLKLDQIDQARNWLGADVLVFDSWHWWPRTGPTQPSVGLHRGGRQGDEGHGPDGGLHHGAQHLGKMGRRQPRPDHHQSLLPGHLPLSLQGTGVGRVGEEDLHGGDGAAEQHGAVPRRADPAAGHHPDSPRRHGQAGLPAGLHLPLAAQEGRAPDQVRRRNLRPGLHPLVHRRPPGHLEHTLLRRAHRPGPIDSFIQ